MDLAETKTIIPRETASKPVEARGAATSPSAPRRNGFKRRYVFVPLLALIAACAVAIVHHLQFAASHPSTDDAAIQGYTVTISSKVAGTVAQIHVQEHDPIKKGQLLVTLDPTDAKIRVQQAQASLRAAEVGVQQAQAAVEAQQHQTHAAVEQARAASEAARSNVPKARTSVTLEARQDAAREAAAASGVATAQSQAQSAAAAADAASAQVRTARANLRNQQATLHKAELDERRFSQLLQQDAVSRQQYDAAEAALQSAQAQVAAAAAEMNAHQEQERAARSQAAAALDAVRQARSNLELAQAGSVNVEVKRQDVVTAQANENQAAATIENALSGYDLIAQRQADVKMARARVDSARAELAGAQQQLDYTRITAPSDGVASEVAVQVGQVVQPQAPLLAEVMSGSRWVVANYKETQLQGMRAGDPATIQVDLSNKTFSGRVLSIGAATGSTFSLLPPENASGNYTKVVQRVPVRIAFEHPDDQALQLGLSVEVTVDTTHRR